MGGNGKRGGGDRVLESRHLVGLFLGVVLLCGVFFTLGYVMGKTQYGGAVHAADSAIPVAVPSPSPKGKNADSAPAPASGEWDFYAKKDESHVIATPKTPAPASVPAVDTRKSGTPPAAATKNVSATPKPPAILQPPKMFKGSVVLQVAALKRESDALATADAIQQKKFPAFVVTPTSDSYYRVQVGPYADDKSAQAAKAALEHSGFKSIIKR
jgi:DedD protein